MKIFCIGCNKEVNARLTDGSERYPHRTDLADIPFWHCDDCGSWVGCHHKTKQRTRPLGYLAPKEIFEARKVIHALLDPLWQGGEITRAQAYAYITRQLGYQYHTGEIKSIEEAKTVWRIVANLHNMVNYDAEIDWNSTAWKV